MEQPSVKGLRIYQFVVAKMNERFMNGAIMLVNVP